MLLPDEIVELSDISEGFDGILVQPGPTAMPLPDLTARLGISIEAAGKTRAAALWQIGLLLDKLGVGYDPTSAMARSARGRTVASSFSGQGAARWSIRKGGPTRRRGP